MTNISKEHIAKLGFKAKDIVTGFAGVITLVSFDLYGCVQIVVTPGVDKDGKTIDGRWFDVTRLEMKSKKPVMVIPEVCSEAINNLGFKAKDIVTEFSGVVSSVGFNMHGHEQFTLTPRVDGDGKSNNESSWFDIPRLKLTSTKPVMGIPDFDKGYIAEGKKGPAEKTLPV